MRDLLIETLIALWLSLMFPILLLDWWSRCGWNGRQAWEYAVDELGGQWWFARNEWRIVVKKWRS